MVFLLLSKLAKNAVRNLIIEAQRKSVAAYKQLLEIFIMRIKFLSPLLLSSLLFATCKQSHDTGELQSKIDSLQKKVDAAYKPGLGEFMSSIQIHHAKLWFAGENNNWKLADFEIHEIMEAVDDIQQFAADRAEVKELPMLLPALDSVNYAINKQDKNLFNRSFVVLTTTCNNCHKAVHYEFNMVKVPDTPPFSNQVFKILNDTSAVRN